MLQFSDLSGITALIVGTDERLLKLIVRNEA